MTALTNREMRVAFAGGILGFVTAQLATAYSEQYGTLASTVAMVLLVAGLSAAWLLEKRDASRNVEGSE